MKKEFFSAEWFRRGRCLQEGVDADEACATAANIKIKSLLESLEAAKEALEFYATATATKMMDDEQVGFTQVEFTRPGIKAREALSRLEEILK